MDKVQTLLMRFVLILLLGSCGGGGGGTEQPAAAGPETGVLRVLETNPRWLTDNSGEARYFTGPTAQWTVKPNATVSTVQDQWQDDVSGVNDYAAAFDTVVADGHNFVRLWSTATSAQGSRAQFASNTYLRVPISQMPWVLVGTRVDTSTGIAVTVGIYDLATFNRGYFDRLRAVVLSAVNKGITPSVMLFNGYENYSVEFSGFAHPMFAANNVNGVSCDANSNARCEETNTLTNTAITAYQDAYVQNVIDTLNDIDGYIYEIANETGVETVTWQNHVANSVSAYESLGGRQRHPVWMSYWGVGDSNSPPSNDYLFHNTHVDIVAPAGADFEHNPPHNHANKPVNVWFHDTDHGGRTGDGIVAVDWPWKSLTRGISPLLLDCPFDVCGREPDSERTRIKRAMAQTLTWANKINLKAMTVETGTSIIGSGYGLYESCAEYLMYMLPDGSHSINLSACSPDHSFTVEFFEPLTGATTSSGTVTGGAAHTFNPQGSNPMVVHVKFIQR